MADDLALPLYPEVEARRYLSKKQKAEVILRQRGRCAGCGIKPRTWEFDHTKARWKGDVDQADLNGWQALGSRRECNCHRDKTAAEAGERAKMNRVRSDTERHASRMKAKASLAREAFKRQRREEAKLVSRSTFDQPPLPNIKARISKSPGSITSGGVSVLSKKHPNYKRPKWPTRKA